MNTNNDLTEHIEYYEDGNIKYKFIYKSDGSPYKTEYYEYESKKIERWFNKRDDDLPSRIDYYENGNVKWNSWDCGRKFGPSYVEYNESGEVICEVNFCWEWEEVSEEEYFRLKSIKDFEDELLNTIPENNFNSKVVKF